MVKTAGNDTKFNAQLCDLDQVWKGKLENSFKQKGTFFDGRNPAITSEGW